MKIELSKKVALVTGGAKGIGRAIVEKLIDNGATTFLVDVDRAAAAEVVEELKKQGKQCEALIGDVSQAKDMEAAVHTIVGRCGRIDILVNNAGINTVRDRAPIHEYSKEDWDQILLIDLTGVFVTSRVVIPVMLENKGGKIVNISSIAGLVPLRLQSAFVAAKAGVVNLTRSMALELGPQRNSCECCGARLNTDKRNRGAYSTDRMAVIPKKPPACFRISRWVVRLSLKKLPMPFYFWSRRKPAILMGPCLP